MPDENGVRYIGDGAWGTLKTDCMYWDEELMEEAYPRTHVWFTEVDLVSAQAKVKFEAYDLDGERLASFE